MKNIKFSLILLLICVMIAGSGCNGNKATKTISVQLVGQKFDRLILEGKPYRADFITPKPFIPIEGKSDDGYLWTFSLPDTLDQQIMFYRLVTAPFDMEKLEARIFELSYSIGNDTLPTRMIYPDWKVDNPTIKLNFLKYDRTFESEVYEANGLYIMEGSIIFHKYYFVIDHADLNQEYELLSSYYDLRYAPLAETKRYAQNMHLYDSLSKQHSDSKLMLTLIYDNLPNFEKVDDISILYNNLAPKSKKSAMGKRILECIDAQAIPTIN